MVPKFGKFYALSNDITYFTSNPSIPLIITEKWRKKAKFGHFGQNPYLKNVISGDSICYSFTKLAPNMSNRTI